MASSENQLGDFIRGRMEFIKHDAIENGLNPESVLKQIMDRAKKLAGTEDRQAFIENRIIRGTILPTSHFPDWLDKVLLEAMTAVMKGEGTSLYTFNSNEKSIAFEAGRFNAKRQAMGAFRILFQGKKPVEWLKTSFLSLYEKCYGASAAKGSRLEELTLAHFKLYLDHRGLEKAGPVDCTTIIGYIYGSLEFLGAHHISIIHESCCLIPRSTTEECIFDIKWE